MDDERSYLRRCERRERRMARLARCDRARQAHERLAGIYAARRARMDGVGLIDATPSRLELARQWWRRLFPAESADGDCERSAITFEIEALPSR